MPKMHVQALTLADLSDGFAGKVIDKAIKTVFEDIADRGDDGQKRTVDIKLTVTPDKNGTVQIEVTAGAKMPAYKPQRTVAKIDNRGGGLLFNSDCSSNPDQQIIPGTGRDEHAEE